METIANIEPVEGACSRMQSVSDDGVA